MKLNNKGFTLVEVLAVVVILGILVAFMYPNVSGLINKNKIDNYEKLMTSVKNSAEIYLSDYKYDIQFFMKKLIQIKE